jgi:hypothetical protein
MRDSFAIVFQLELPIHTPQAARHMGWGDHTSDVRSEIIYTLTALLLDRPAKLKLCHDHWRLSLVLGIIFG